MTNILIKLDLHDVHDTALVEFAADKVRKINMVAALAAVVPSTTEVDAKRAEYARALTDADNGTRADTAFKNEKRDELRDLLKRQALDCAKIANGNSSLYLSSGYAAKDIKGNPTGPLHAVTGLRLEFSDNEGEIKAFWKSMPKAANFSVEVFSNALNPEGSIIKRYLKSKLGKKMTVLDGLPSGQIVYVRVRANGGSTGHGPWSDIGRIRVP